MSTSTTDLSIDERIAAAFGDGITSDEVAALTNEAIAASRSANEAAEQARARALDPTLSARQVAEARRQMEDAAFARDRLSAAVPRLQQRRKELVEAEEDARRWVAYEKAKVERDKLAEELTHVIRLSPSSSPSSLRASKRTTSRSSTSMLAHFRQGPSSYKWRSLLLAAFQVSASPRRVT